MKKKIISIALSLAIAASTLTSLSVVAYAKDEVAVPEPLAVYDFSYDFEELAENNPGFEVVENEAKPELIQDEEMGQVLKLNKSIVGNRKWYKQTDNETGQISEVPVIETEDSKYSQINITNPYKGVDHLKEYEDYEDVKLKFWRNIEQPDWKEGITITYWIKTPAGENGYGVNSNVVGFTSNRFMAQADDWAKHRTTIRFDLEYNELTDEQRKLFGTAVERCGVLPDSMFYFEYATEEPYLNAPLYKASKLGACYTHNKFYVQGHKQSDAGGIDKTDAALYDTWHEAPYWGDTAEDHDPGDSMLRYTWAYSEMWLDASSSFFMCMDIDKVNKQLNPNYATAYGTQIGVMNNDVFNINSWKCPDNTFINYDEADSLGVAADSPVIYPEEWHMVTCVIQNDWVVYYFDDEEIDMEEIYSGSGKSGYPEPEGNFKPWKRFNKGTGSRYGYGHNKTETFNCSYGNYIAPTIMDWLILDCVNVTIGGGNKAGDLYQMYADTDEIQIKNVVFYDTMLNDDQIEFLVENPQYYAKTDEDVTTGMMGDTDLNEIIDASDALAVLKHAAALEILEGQPLENADVNFDEIIDASDALDILKKAAGLITEFVKPEAPTV